MPQLISDLTGCTFPTLFAEPFGKRRSASTVNLLCGVPGLLAAWLLIERVGDFDLMAAAVDGAFRRGVLLAALGLAWGFSRLRGNNAPTESSDTA